MDNIINMLVGDLVLSPDLLFVARCLALLIVVDVLTSLISIVVPLVKSINH